MVSDLVVTEAQVIPSSVVTDATIVTVISETQANEPLVPGNTGSTRDEATKEADAQIEGEDSSGRTLKTSEEKRKDKGKKPMTYAEELANMQKEKEEKQKRMRGEGTDSLKLKADTQFLSTNPLGLILSEADREVAMKAQLEFDQRESLAERIAKEEADQVKATNALQAQKEEFENLKKAAEAKNEEIEWFKKRINTRQNDSQIIDASIHPPKPRVSPLLVSIKRADTHKKLYRPEWLEVLSITEWLELGNHISKSRSKFKESVLDVLRKLFVKLVRIQRENKITVSQENSQQLYLIQRLLRGQPMKHPRNKKKGHFAMLHDQGIKIDASGIDLSIPTKAAQPEQTIINEPDFGIFFEDIFGSIGFFRIRDIPNATSSFLRAIIGVPQRSEDGDLIVRLIMNELKEREPANPDPSNF